MFHHKLRLQGQEQCLPEVGQRLEVQPLVYQVQMVLLQLARVKLPESVKLQAPEQEQVPGEPQQLARVLVPVALLQPEREQVPEEPQQLELAQPPQEVL